MSQIHVPDRAVPFNRSPLNAWFSPCVPNITLCSDLRQVFKQFFLKLVLLVTDFTEYIFKH
uniref:Uncharacterized protein n=1 Tax=Anguilla anguilla TaxID=7936 RepID=A0A0E9Q8Z6_ANGAN